MKTNVLSKVYSEKDLAYYAHERHEMLQFIPKGVKSILDVGCSNGEFGALLKQRFNCEVWGIEPDENSAQKAKQVLDKVYNTIFDQDIDLNGKKFDCIIFNDVLEHLVDPYEALQLCKNHLDMNGVIVSSIPNIRFFDAVYQIVVNREFRYTGAGIFDKTHLRFFTQKSIERMFKEGGYEIVTIEGINSIKELNMRGYKNFKLLNTLLFNKIWDMEFQQFAVVAKL